MLIAAWVCANTPQIAIIGLVVWIGEARTFSHQERLSLQVARLLTGERDTTTVKAAQSLPAHSPLPVIPTDIFAKKLDLALEQTSEVLPRALRLHARVAEQFPLPGSFRAAPPHEPPRLVADLS